MRNPKHIQDVEQFRFSFFGKHENIAAQFGKRIGDRKTRYT